MNKLLALVWAPPPHPRCSARLQRGSECLARPLGRECRLRGLVQVGVGVGLVPIAVRLAVPSTTRLVTASRSACAGTRTSLKLRSRPAAAPGITTGVPPVIAGRSDCQRGDASSQAADPEDEVAAQDRGRSKNWCGRRKPLKQWSVIGCVFRSN